MGFTTEKFLAERGKSAISGLLNMARNRIPAAEPVEQAFEEPVRKPLSTAQKLYQRFAGNSDTEEPSDEDLSGPTHPYEYQDAKVIYIPLTEDQMIASAESKTEMYAAMIAIVLCGLKSWAAKTHLKPGDKTLIDEHDRRERVTGNTEVYAPNNPYYLARERYTKYAELLKEAEESALKDVHKALLYRAFLEDIRQKDYNKRYKTAGVWATVGEIMLAQMAETSMTLIVDQIMRLSK